MWSRIRSFFKDSETLFLARLQAAIGAVAIVVTYVEPSVLAPVLPGEWVPWFFALHGVLLEYLRRRRADDL